MGTGDEAKPLLRGQAVVERRSWLARWYYKQGKFVATYPKLTALVCVIFVAWTCVGLIYVDVESNPEKIWVPPSSVTQVQQQYFNFMFTPFYRIEEVYFSTPQDKGNNMITVPYLLAMLDLQVRARTTPGLSRALLAGAGAARRPACCAASCTLCGCMLGCRSSAFVVTCRALCACRLVRYATVRAGGHRDDARQQREHTGRPVLQAHHGQRVHH